MMITAGPGWLRSLPFVLLLSASASAQQVPALESVPDALPDPPRNSLKLRYADLAATRDSLRSRIRDRDARCRIYYTNSPEAKECPDLTARLEGEKDVYIAAVNKFNWDLSQEVGGYRNKLERRVAELDEGLRNDATAIRQLGFDRRAEDFAEWAKLSTDAHRLAFVKLMNFVVDESSDLLAKGVFAQIRALYPSRFGPDEARDLLAKMDGDNLVNPDARAYLRDVARGISPWQESKLVEALHKDLRKARDVVIAGNSGQNLEAALKLVKWIAPPHIRMGADLAEMAVWVGYDVAAQTVAGRQVRRLTELTESQLKALDGIVCVTQRRLTEKYEVNGKLAALDGRPFDQPKPIVSSRCERRPM